MALFGHSGENKSKSLIKQITGSLSGFIITIILLAIAVNAVASIIMGIVRLLSDEGKKQTAYDQIKNRGGAYTYLEDDALKRLGNYDVVSKIFQTEYYSYDAVQSEFTIPRISYNDLKEKYEAGETNAPETTVLWDLNSFTYNYRTHWEILLALGSLQTMTDSDAFDAYIEKAAEKMNDDGEIQDADTIFDAVTVNQVEKVTSALQNKGLFTDIEYYTNYASDNTHDSQYNMGSDKVREVSSYWNGVAESDMVSSGYTIDKYTGGYNNFLFENPALVTFSNSNPGFYWFSEQKVGNCESLFSPKGYSYVTTAGNVYPVMLIKKAYNWLWKYDAFGYVKTSSTGQANDNTEYKVVKYTKTSRIKDFLDLMHTPVEDGGLGIDESLDSVFIQLLTKAQEIGGGTIATEFENAYNYYLENGEELVIHYYEPLYAGVSGNEIITEEDRNSFSQAVDTLQTDTAAMRNDMAKIFEAQANKSSMGLKHVSTNVGLSVARVLYKYKCPYEKSYTTEEIESAEDAGQSTKGLMHCGNYTHPVDSPGWAVIALQPAVYGKTNSSADTAETQNMFFGDYKNTVIYDFQGGRYNTSTQADIRIGLSRSGFICYILRTSLFCTDGGGTYKNMYQWCDDIRNCPSISTIYNSWENWKFQSRDELIAGDLAVVTTSDMDGDGNNIGYYVGKDSDGRHIFYYMDASSGYTERACLKGESGDSVLQEVDFKYFFRFYRGSSGMSKDAPVMKYVEEYEDTSTVRYQPFSIYKAVMENWQLENLLKNKRTWSWDGLYGTLRNILNKDSFSDEEIKHFIAGLNCVEDCVEKEEWVGYTAWAVSDIDEYESNERDDKAEEKFKVDSDDYDSFHQIVDIGNVLMQSYNNASDEQKSIAYQAIYNTEACSKSGWCAQWVIDIYNASVGYVSTGLGSNDANKMWEKYCRNSDLKNLKVGMIIAVQHSSLVPGSDGWIYGHVGIYIGDGKVRHNVGGIKECTVEQFIEWFDVSNTVGWGFANPDINYK